MQQVQCLWNLRRSFWSPQDQLGDHFDQQRLIRPPGTGNGTNSMNSYEGAHYTYLIIANSVISGLLGWNHGWRYGRIGWYLERENHCNLYQQRHGLSGHEWKMSRTRKNSSQKTSASQISFQSKLRSMHPTLPLFRRRWTGTTLHS